MTANDISAREGQESTAINYEQVSLEKRTYLLFGEVEGPVLLPEDIVDELDRDVTEAEALAALENLECEGVVKSKPVGNSRVWFVAWHNGGDDLDEARERQRAERKQLVDDAKA